MFSKTVDGDGSNDKSQLVHVEKELIRSSLDDPSLPDRLIIRMTFEQSSGKDVMGTDRIDFNIHFPLFRLT